MARVASPRRIMIIQGHPDPEDDHLCHALERAYSDAATAAGHEVRLITISKLDFPILRSQKAFYGPLPETLEASKETLQWADHLLILYPLWLGTMPALLKAYIEQLFRPGVALAENAEGWPRSLLKNKSCHIVVTMGMPAFAYRLFFRAHSLRSLERNILRFSGIKPVRDTLIGMVDSADEQRREKWFARMRRLGKSAS